MVLADLKDEMRKVKWGGQNICVIIFRRYCTDGGEKERNKEHDKRLKNYMKGVGGKYGEDQGDKV